MDKAVIVGIADYGSLYPKPLTGAANALTAWQTLLVGKYGFVAKAKPGDPPPNLHVVENTAATKETILLHLEWLVKNAGTNDRLLFIFCGHGTALNRQDPVLRVVNVEQGLVCYPRTAKIQDAVLYGDEILNEIRLPSRRITLVFDACFSGGVIDDPTLQPLYIDPTVTGTTVVEGVQQISFLQRLKIGREASSFSMVIAAASREFEPAVEGEVTGVRHLLFSYHATNALQSQPTYSYNELFAIVRPHLSPAQIPVLDGDPGRHPKDFTY